MPNPGTVSSYRLAHTKCVVAACPACALLGLPFGTVSELFDGDVAVLHMPLLVANALNKIRLWLNHDDAAAEGVQSLGKSFHGLYVKVIGGLVYRNEVGLGPKHGGQRQPNLLACRESADLTIATHLLVNAEGFTMPGNLAARQRPLVETSSLGSNALIACNYSIVQAHCLEF